MLWIYLILGRERYEFNILLKKKNLTGRKPESYNRDIKSFSGGTHRIFIKYCFKEKWKPYSL